MVAPPGQEGGDTCRARWPSVPVPYPFKIDEKGEEFVSGSYETRKTRGGDRQKSLM